MLSEQSAWRHLWCLSLFCKFVDFLGLCVLKYPESPRMSSIGATAIGRSAKEGANESTQGKESTLFTWESLLFTNFCVSGELLMLLLAKYMMWNLMHYILYLVWHQNPEGIVWAMRCGVVFMHSHLWYIAVGFRVRGKMGFIQAELTRKGTVPTCIETLTLMHKQF